MKYLIIKMSSCPVKKCVLKMISCAGVLFLLLAHHLAMPANSLAINGTDGDDVIVCDPVDDGTNVQGFGGDDVIEVVSGDAAAIRGDVGVDIGGDDTITLYEEASATHVAGDNLPSTATQYGNDEITIYGTVSATNTGVAGDVGTSTTVVGGNDRIVIESGATVNVPDGTAVSGDSSYGDGGDDTLVVCSTAVIVGDLKGDGVGGDGDGGNDTIIFAGTINGVIGGDVVYGSGGDDIIAILPAGEAEYVKGDAADVDGGNDTITIAGTATLVQGDDTFNDGGNDTIALTKGAKIEVRDSSDTAEGGIAGDGAYRDGGNDFIIIRGEVPCTVAGDGVNRNGGKDFIRIYPAAVIGGSVSGDGSTAGHGYSGGKGGDDTIVTWPGATIEGPVSGDSVVTQGGNDKLVIRANVATNVCGDVVTDGDGGNDSIGVGQVGVIEGSLIGDQATGDGGADILDVSGTVKGSIQGDGVSGGDGGNDIIYIRPTANVKTIYGDLATNGNGGDDTIIVQGTVVGNIIPDQVGYNRGNDSVIVSGTVTGHIYDDDPASTSTTGGDDTIKILPAGVVNGNIVAKGGGTNRIVIMGTVNGNVFCDADTDTLVVYPTATITGSRCK